MMRLVFAFGSLLLAGFVLASSLLDEYRTLQRKTQTLATYTTQLQALISDQEKSLKTLQESIAKHGNLKRQLMPVAYQMLNALKDFVHNDIPFQKEQRIKAIDDALQLMTDASVSDAMKFQLVLDLYEIERNYGYTVETWKGKLKRDDNRLVAFLRIGRSVLIYREMDTDNLMFWDVRARTWHILPDTYRTDVLRAMQTAEDTVLSDLFIFPLPPPQLKIAPSNLLDTLKRKAQANAEIDRQREQTFLQQKNKQSQVLAQLRAEYQKRNKQSDKLEARFEKNRIRLTEVKSMRQQRMGDALEIFATVRNSAYQIRDSLAGTFMGLLLPNWRARIEAIAKPDVFALEQIHQLADMMLEEMALQRGSHRVHTKVITDEGQLETRAVTVVGIFSALSDGRFLRYLPDNQLPIFATHQPPLSYLSAAKHFEQLAGTQSYVGVPLDLSRGMVFSILERTPSLMGRIKQGGVIGLIILLLGAIGFVLVVERIIVLNAVARVVNRQLGDKQFMDSNPLGRVLESCAQLSTSNYEEIELKLQAAILKETASLERGFGIIKALASVLPLLGLLGTVVGMIETFQAITLFGNNDPQLMADGISQALVTTMLGLGIAIPLLLLYVVAAGFSRKIRNILEQQSAGVLALNIGQS